MAHKRGLKTAILLALGLVLAAPSLPAQTQSKEFDITRTPLFEELNLSADQKSQIQKLHQDNSATFEKNRQDFLDAKAQFEQVMDNDADDATIRERFQAFQKAQDALLVEGLEESLSIRKILTPAQRKQFQASRKKMAEKPKAGATPQVNQPKTLP